MRSKAILALGSDIKNRFLFAKGRTIYFGPDMGDLSRAANYESFQRQISKVIRKNKPDIIAHDLHPGYFSSLLAKDLARRSKCRSLIAVQHHHAHIASVIAEKRIKKPVIGVSFDGTGFGTDENFWGGEFLLVDNNGFSRLAHLKYRKMPGSDKVVYEPWRMVLSILGDKAKEFIEGVDREDIDLVSSMLSRGINSPLSSSAGRLFDAAAALAGLCLHTSYEAEGPIKLQTLCRETIEDSYGFVIDREDSCYIIDTDPIFLAMAKDLKKGGRKETVATRFHNSMAEIITNTVKKISADISIKDIVLSGGVFQNEFLTGRVTKSLTSLGFSVFINEKHPFNDLNISLGQYYVAYNTDN